MAEVGEVKSQYGLPIYVPERESAMLASRREEAAGARRTTGSDRGRSASRDAESYSSENDKGFKTLQPNLRPVVIVGGGGQMGRLFEKMLTLSGYQVRILEKKRLGPGRRDKRRRCRHGYRQRTDSHHRGDDRQAAAPFRRIAFWLTLPR